MTSVSLLLTLTQGLTPGVAQKRSKTAPHGWLILPQYRHRNCKRRLSQRKLNSRQVGIPSEIEKLFKLSVISIPPDHGDNVGNRKLPHFKPLGLHNFVRGFKARLIKRGAYIWIGLIIKTKKRFSEQAEQHCWSKPCKTLFEFTRFFKLQNRIHSSTS